MSEGVWWLETACVHCRSKLFGQTSGEYVGPRRVVGGAHCCCCLATPGSAASCPVGDGRRRRRREVVRRGEVRSNGRGSCSPQVVAQTAAVRRRSSKAVAMDWSRSVCATAAEQPCKAKSALKPPAFSLVSDNPSPQRLQQRIRAGHY